MNISSINLKNFKYEILFTLKSPQIIYTYMFEIVLVSIFMCILNN